MEISKAAPSPETPRILREGFRGILKLLHPVMPSATEETWRILDGEGLIIDQPFPCYDASLEDPDAVRRLDLTRAAVTAVRSFRADSSVEGELEGKAPEGVELGVFSSLAGVRPADSSDGTFTATLPAGDGVVELALSEDMRRGEVERLRKEISRVEGEVKRAEGKLSNERFVEKAPAPVVEAEREKLRANGTVLDTLRTRLEEYL